MRMTHERLLYKQNLVYLKELLIHMETQNKDFPDHEKWLGSFEDVNEFENHYSKNKNIWDKAFEWLKTTDLNNLAPGKYEIDGGRAYALVAEYDSKKTDDTLFEAHKKFIDIQYIVKGREMIGVAALSSARIIETYNDDKDIAFYEIPEAECKYYLAEPGKYFIFFPGDAHRPGIKVEDAEKVRKVVVKVRK